jgi:hypothetical protein
MRSTSLKVATADD